TILQIAWTNTSASFRLSNKRVLSFACASHAPACVQWTLLAEHCLTQQRDLPRDITFQYSGESSQYQWPRAELIEYRLGRRVTMVFESEFGVLLYCDGCALLRFSSLRRVGHGDLILTWWDSE